MSCVTCDVPTEEVESVSMSDNGSDSHEVILYSTHCPKCVVLQKKLDEKGIKYAEVNDVKKMLAMRIMQAPMLYADGELKDFSKAVSWVNNQ